MMRNKIKINSKGFNDILDITQAVTNILLSSNLQDGLLNLYINSTKASFVVMDIEAFREIDKVLSDICKNKNVNAEFFNIASSFKASYFKNSLTLPFENNKIIIKENEKIYFVNFENCSDTKEIIVSLIG